MTYLFGAARREHRAMSRGNRSPSSRRVTLVLVIIASHLTLVPIINATKAVAASSGTLAFAAIEGDWVAAGGPASVAATAAAITGAEASFQPGDIQPYTSYCGSGSDKTGWGLWQITCGNSAAQFGVDFQILDPWNNAEAAVAKYVGANNSFSPWSTFNSGAYKQYLPSSPPAPLGQPDPGQYTPVNSAPAGTNNSSLPGTTSSFVEPGDLVVHNPAGGYWIMDPSGTIKAYGGAPNLGQPAGQGYFAGQIAVGLAPASGGYWVLSSSGGIYSFGSAPFQGSADGQSYFAGQRAVGLTSNSAGNGYWIVSASGGVYTYNAPFFGAPSLGSGAVGLYTTPANGGYWVLSSSGAVYSYGNATYEGGANSQAVFAGQTAASMTTNLTSTGYWILSDSGQVLNFGSASNYGGANGQSYFAGQGAVSIAANGAGTGYWILGNSGSIYTYGNATYYGGGF